MTRSEKWLLGGLGLSLALNGLLAALIFFHPGPHHDRHRGPDVRVGRLEKHLAPESRDVLREAVAQNRDALRLEFDAMRTARDGIARALEQEPFDRAALEAAFAEAGRHRDAIQATVQQSFIEAAGRLPVEERVKLAKGGERYMRRLLDPRRDGDKARGRRGDERRGDGPPPPAEPTP
ncbi:periplasmic heavy metal sensor [Emcibacter sp. SYSU 3D8]|uniref:periplasmic heavy metal sensor n=1 Tax=Emcibacter sp. SYSU 3D8 TaxID=3133969 RepID=UPI0031FEE070